jgi:hypothetical protein
MHSDVQRYYAVTRPAPTTGSQAAWCCNVEKTIKTICDHEQTDQGCEPPLVIVPADLFAEQ